MQTRHRIALLTAGVLIGAQIGVASVSVPVPDTAEQMEPVAGDAQALESKTSTEPTETQAEAAPAPEESSQSLIAAAQQPIIPVPVRYADPRTSTFPPSTDDRPLLRSVAAYLERTEHLRITGASGNVFPPSTDDRPLLRSVAVYLDQRHALLLAEESRSQVASAPSVRPAPATEPTPAAMATPLPVEPTPEISVVDAGSPLTQGTPF
jgi:hypothetical protein